MTIKPIDDEDVENRKEKKDYLQEWMNKYQDVTDVAPFVNNELKKTEWEYDALRNRPDISDEILADDLSSNLENDLLFTKENLPMLPVINKKKLPVYASGSSTGTAAVYVSIARIGDLPDEKARNFSFTYKSKYEDLQKVQNRSGEVRKLLEKFDEENILERFDLAIKKYQQYELDYDYRTSAASDIRTFIDGLKGQLMAKAMTHTTENRPSWVVISQRIGRMDLTDYQRKKIECWGEKHSNYVGRLTSILKDRKEGSVTDLTVIWTELLDQIFALLNLIEFG